MPDDFKELLHREAVRSLADMGGKGEMPAGCNGPYGDPETPLRNTCHWFITLLAVGKATSETRLLEAADKALQYILLPEHRPDGASWIHRNKRGKDFCNGLIGPAWTMEALSLAANCFNNDRARQVAFDVWRQFRFNPDLGLWNRLEVDGRVLGIDQTFNHQLWFAASLAQLAALGFHEVQLDVSRFMDRLLDNFTVYPSGLIRHRIRLRLLDYINEPRTLPNRLHLRLKQIKEGAPKPMNTLLRDAGYHAFNLHAFATLKRFCPNHPFWDRQPFQSALNFALSKDFLRLVSGDNPYSFPYNPVGAEMAFALKVFCPDATEDRGKWLQLQMASVGSHDRYGAEVFDPSTARARLYEAVPVFWSS